MSHHPANMAPGERVSILVFVELALDGYMGQPAGRPAFGVSILVFVELALDVQEQRIQRIV